MCRASHLMVHVIKQESSMEMNTQYCRLPKFAARAACRRAGAGLTVPHHTLICSVHRHTPPYTHTGCVLSIRPQHQQAQPQQRAFLLALHRPKASSVFTAMHEKPFSRRQELGTGFAAILPDRGQALRGRGSSHPAPAQPHTSSGSPGLPTLSPLPGSSRAAEQPQPRRVGMQHHRLQGDALLRARVGLQRTVLFGHEVQRRILQSADNRRSDRSPPLLRQHHHLHANPGLHPRPGLQGAHCCSH